MIVIKFIFLGSLFSFTMYELKRKVMMVLDKGVQSFKKQKLPKKRRVRNELWAFRAIFQCFLVKTQSVTPVT